MKKEFVLSILFLSLIMLSTMTLTVSATDYTKVGVKVGDTADYTYSNPNGTGRLRVHILQITGTNVTANIREVYSNGSEGTDNIFTIDLSTGTLLGGTEAIKIIDDRFHIKVSAATYILLFSNFLVAANLSKGDTTTPQDTEYTIDETTTMNVAGLNRTVNHVCFWIIQSENLPGYYYFDAYWDRITGLATGMNISFRDDSTAAWINVSEGSFIYNLTSTTAFTTQSTEQDPIVLLATTGAITIVLVAVAIAAIAQKKQKASRP